jgi:DNA invertase Pin-like site-specific DNA recombinase
MSQCLIYCRVSTEEQAEKGFSLDAQEKLCRDFAERQGYAVAGVYRDEGKSGTTLERPALQDMLAQCTKGTSIQAVIVQETDRLARNTHGHLTIRAVLKNAGVKLISVNQPMLDDSPEGNMIDTILASVNQFQSDLSGRKIRKALQEKFDQGWWPRWAPLGYLSVVVGEPGDGQRVRKVVQNDPAKWHLVQEGFKLYLTGDYSANEVRDLLHERGLRSKKGKQLSHSVMVKTLANPFYAGMMHWHGQRHIGRHEAMITLPEHERILEIFHTHNLGRSRRRRHNFLLRGFVFCNVCGHRLTAEIHPAKSKSYYHCAIRTHSNRGQNVEVSDLEQQVAKRFKEIEFSPQLVDVIVTTLTEVSTQQRQMLNVKKQAIFNQQKAIEAKRDRAEEKLLAGILPDDAFVRLRTNFSQQLQGLQNQFAALNSQRECDIEVIREVLAMTKDVYRAYQKAQIALKRQYLGLFWERFVVEDRDIVEAVPSRLIRELQEKQSVILSTREWSQPPLIITFLDVAYLKSLREKVEAIKALRKEVDLGENRQQLQQAA